MKRFCRSIPLLAVLFGALPGRSGAADAALEVHTVRGVVRSIAADRKTAVIRHEAIPNYMPAMTMELSVLAPVELQGIQAGDAISFRLLANEETHWIDTIRVVAATNAVPIEPTPAPRIRPPELKPGDVVPDVGLRSETGQIVRLSDFQGRAVALTFIFTRCPLPDFCPRMGRGFASARTLLLNDSQAPTNWQFLSISFDADYDQPEVLARYAKNYRGDTADRWLYAAAGTNALAELAPRLDLMVNREGGGFAHNLRTVVLDTRGRLFRQFDGNQWSGKDLAEALRRAALAGETGAKP